MPACTAAARTRPVKARRSGADEAGVIRGPSRLDFQLRPVEDHDPASSQPERPTSLFFPEDPVQRRPGRPRELRQLLLGEIDLYDLGSAVVYLREGVKAPPDPRLSGEMESLHQLSVQPSHRRG